MSEIAPKHWVLLRGLARQHKHWFDFPEQFQTALGVSCSCLDLPGAGTERSRKSPIDLTGIGRDVARRLPRSDEPMGIVGLSLGGMVALELCRQQPNRFSHLVVINSSSRLSRLSERINLQALLKMGRAATKTPLALERRAYAVTTRQLGVELEKYAQQAAWIALREPISKSLTARQLLAASRWVPPSYVSQDCLVLSARGDALVSSACSTPLAALLRAEHMVHPHAGHDLPLDDPTWVCDRVDGWLKQPAKCRP